MAKIEWKGGECPVSCDTLVKCYFVDGSVGERLAKYYLWSDKALLAYEVIEEEPKQIIENTLRDEFAKVWLKDFPRQGNSVDEIAGECYDMADAMMKARAK